jgi:serine/threonine protein kinase/WD40 repeat protein
MNFPDEALWARVEKLGEEMSDLPPDRISKRLSQLAAEGEAPTVITLLSTWLSLPPPPAVLAPGTLLAGRYVLKEKLGEGGMGAVWRASQELISRDVAVKMIHPSLVTPALNARFAGEMKVLGQLNHPGIVKIFDAGVHAQPDRSLIPFFVMELIEGQPLDSWAAPQRGHYVELLRVLGDICDALDHAHEREIVHRDLKPRNVLVRPNGQPVVVDFGIARLRGLVLGEEEGAFSGTPQYAAPEQHLGRDHDFRSGTSVDIYALGAILFELIAGTKLFEFARGVSIAEMRKTVLESPVPRLSQIIPGCPPALEEVVSRAVRRDPADRFYSMAAVRRAIGRVAASIASPQSTPPPWSPATRAVVPGTSWVLSEKIGEGGAGEVWIGQHKQLGEQRVFKFCDTEEKARTLKREVTLFRLLKERVGRNPHFIPLHEVSLDEPPFYLMMDHVEARGLENWCASQPGGLAGLPENRRLEIVIQAADALQAAHEAGILHRDIKPANLLLRNDAAELHVFVADFGIGQIVTDQVLRDVTRLGFTHTVSNLRTDRLSGTLLYLAPEVVEGAPATARSDIYSLGVVLWQLFAGNLRAALDPSDWPDRIEDSILREILRRCLAGSPEKRWASAGELAMALRSLPERRQAEERRAMEMRSRERAAYRRGVLRATAVAVAIIVLIAALAIIAILQQRAAERARGEIALDQAEALSRSDQMADRIRRGLNLLEIAAKTSTNLAALRSAAGSVLAMADLTKSSLPAAPLSQIPSARVPPQTGEVLRAFSEDGTLLAIARDIDGRNGAIDLYESFSGHRRFTFTRKDFPWVPIAERGICSFSPDKSLLAVGGAATSRHVLIVDCMRGELRSYIFHGSDPLSCAWHPTGRLVVTGCADGSIRIWDLSMAAVPAASAPGNQFDLPPKLDAPALDIPVQLLEGQRGGVEHLAFSKNGSWLAALDHSGYLRVFDGFPARPAPMEARNRNFVTPMLVVETQIAYPEQVEGFSASEHSIVIDYGGGKRETFDVLEPGLPEEFPVAADLEDLDWDDQGANLCVTSRTDSYWFKSSPLEFLFRQVGNNPVAARWDTITHSWLLPVDDRLGHFRLGLTNGLRHLEPVSSFTLREAEKGQGALTGIAVTHDGRIAAYHGRQIQFFHDNSALPDGLSIASKAPGETFQQILWDTKGQLLGVSFSTNHFFHLESWKTTAGLPSKWAKNNPAVLNCDTLTVANDGQNFIGRGAQEGLFLFDPATQSRKILIASIVAREGAPIACTSDGRLLAMVVAPNKVRLLETPSGVAFADLPKTRERGEITALRWDRSGSRLAALTDNGWLQIWKLGPWQQWLTAHHLAR